MEVFFGSTEAIYHRRISAVSYNLYILPQLSSIFLHIRLRADQLQVYIRLFVSIQRFRLVEEAQLLEIGNLTPSWCL